MNPQPGMSTKYNPNSANIEAFGATEKSQISEIQQELNTYSDIVSQLEEAVGMLCGKLNPVLVPPVPANPKLSGTDSPPRQSSIGVQLQTNNSRFMHLVDVVHTIRHETCL